MMTNKLKNRISKLAVRMLTAQLEDNPKSTGHFQFWIANHAASVFCRRGQWYCKVYYFSENTLEPVVYEDVPI